MRLFLKIFLYIWQLPQNLVGLLFFVFLKPYTLIERDYIATIYSSPRMSGGISLGKYAFVSKVSSRSEINLRHEAVGHAKQSLYFGPLYLFIIGISSIVWAWLYGWIIPESYNGYYKFWTERWADRLAGIKRDFNGN